MSNEIWHRCPACGLSDSYPANLAGTGVLCRNRQCGAGLNLPAVNQDSEVEPVMLQAAPAATAVAASWKSLKKLPVSVRRIFGNYPYVKFTAAKMGHHAEMFSNDFLSRAATLLSDYTSFHLHNLMKSTVNDISLVILHRRQTEHAFQRRVNYVSLVFIENLYGDLVVINKSGFVPAEYAIVDSPRTFVSAIASIFIFGADKSDGACEHDHRFHSIIMKVETDIKLSLSALGVPDHLINVHKS